MSHLRLPGALLLMLLLTAVALAERDEPADPLPLRRVVLPLDRLPTELKRVRDGVLAQISRKEFDALVTAAARAAREGREPPRLVETRYRASLTDAPALAGSAQWKLLNPTGKPALLRFSGAPMNLAVAKPRFENREALIGEFPDPQTPTERVLALLVDQPGEHTLTLDWSARVEPRPEGLQVDLRLPYSPAASLELDLPADRMITPLESALVVSGPHPAEDDDRRLWRIATGGQTSVRLLIRRAGGRGVVFSREKTVQKLTPDGVESLTTFTLETLHQDVLELLVEVDAALRPVEVTAAGLERWEVRPEGVFVRLERPARQATLQVRSLAPLFAGAEPVKQAGFRPWVSPGVRLKDAVPRGESLEVWIHPELSLGSWQPGDYQLASSGTVVDPETKASMTRLELLGGGLAPATEGRKPTPRRPGASIQVGAVEFRARQLASWRLGGEGMELTARIEYQVRQGLMFQLPIRTPPGWAVESVDLTPAESLRSWGVRVEKGVSLLLIDLRKPLGGDGVVFLRLRPVQAQPLAGRDLAFPEITPVGALRREGGLAIDVDDQLFTATVRTEAQTANAPADGPWENGFPDYYYPHTGQPLVGVLHLGNRPGRLRGRALSDVFLSAVRAALTTRLHLEGETGQATAVDVIISPATTAWEWQVENGARLGRVEPLVHREVASAFAALSATTPLSLAILQASRPNGSFWRLHLDRPLAPGRQVTLLATIPLEAAGAPDQPAWPVPLTVMQGSSSDNEVTIHTPDGAVSLTGRGLRDGPSPRGTAWRTLRYADPWARLLIQTRSGPTPVNESAIRDARLTSTLTRGELVHLFAFRLARWSQRTVPVRLPEGARLSAVAINGRWLERVEEAESVVEIPVPAGAEPRFEMLYTSVAHPGLLGARLEAPAPVLPLVPLSFERVWRVPPGTVPLLPSRMRRAGEGDSPSAWQRLAGLLRLGGPLPLTRITPQPVPRDVVGDALAVQASRRAGQTITLGEAIEELASAVALEGGTLLVDQTALATAGRARATPLRFPATTLEKSPMVDAGLAFFRTPAGTLLTTIAEMRSVIHDAPLAQASEGGRDPSGRFLTALEWLAADSPRPAPHLLDTIADRAGWVEYTPLAGAEHDELTVVRSRMTRGLGLLAALLVVAAFLLARRARTRTVGLLILATTSGLAVVWLPASLTEVAWWPLLACLICACGGFLVWASLRQPVAKKVTPSTLRRVGVPLSTSALVLIGLTLALPCQPAVAQKVEPDLVFLVGPPERGSVLLSRAVLEKLKALASASAAPTSGAVLLDAVYDGKLVKGQAEFDAVLHAHNLDDTPATLELPLDGVALSGEVLVDGARAFPVALAAPKTGYAIKLRGKGRHKIQLTFRAAVQAGTGEGSETSGSRLARFTLPRLVQSRLTFRAEAGVSHLLLPTRHGGQRLVSENKSERLEADLGALSGPVQLRWHQDGKQPKPPQIRFREAYLWDIAGDASTLTAFLRYDVADGAVSSLRIEVPEGLEVRSAIARRPAASTDGPVRLSDWSVSGKDDAPTLRLDLPGPVTGAFEVVVELVLRGPWAGPATLPVLKPHGEATAATQAYLAYRTRGVDVTRIQPLRLSGIEPKQFAPFWTTGRPAPESLSYASTFRSQAEPVLRLDVRPARPRPAFDQDVTLRIGPRKAEWLATVNLSSTTEVLLLEGDLVASKPVTLTGVSGADVRGWAQSGGRVIVWLNGPTRKTRIDLTGWLPLDVPAAKDKKPVSAARLDLPAFRPLPFASMKTRLTLLPEPGLTLQAETLQDLTRVGQPSSRPLVYQSSGPNPQGAFQVRPGAGPVASIDTEVSRQGRELILTGRVEVQGANDQRAFQVNLRDWPGEAWLESSKGAVRRREQYRRAATRREWHWTIERPDGQAGPVTLIIRGRLDLDEVGEFAAPNLYLPGVRAQQTIHVAGLTAEPTAGLTALPATAADRQSWRVSGASWGLQLMPREPARPVARVVLGEHRARVEDGRRWTHEATWWMWQQGPAALTVAWPGLVELLAATIDGQPIPLTRGERGQLWLPLSGQGGIRQVRVRWRYPSDRETLERPDLTSPRLSGTTVGAMLWTVDVPPGWEVSVGNGLRGSSRRAVVELYRARAHLELTRALAELESTGPALSEAVGRLDRALKLAGLALEAGASGRSPEGKPLAEWRARLLVESEALRQPGSEQIGGESTDPGTPLTWASEKDDPAPRVRLLAASQRDTAAALLASGQWLMLMLGVCLIARWSPLRVGVRWLWPEVVVLVGVLGWSVAGPTVPVLFLLAVGVIGRVVLLVQGVTWLMRRRPANVNSVA